MPDLDLLRIITRSLFGRFGRLYSLQKFGLRGKASRQAPVSGTGRDRSAVDTGGAVCVRDRGVRWLWVAAHSSPACKPPRPPAYTHASQLLSSDMLHIHKNSTDSVSSGSNNDQPFSEVKNL